MTNVNAYKSDAILNWPDRRLQSERTELEGLTCGLIITSSNELN